MSGISKKLLVILISWCLCITSCRKNDPLVTTIDFWAIGSEGERVQAMLGEFERANPQIKVRVQQLPWNAAHEKLITAFAGDATPDVCQLGNTWIPELAALEAVAPLDALLRSSPSVPADDYFPGVWETSQVGGQTFGIPWYADTRLMFYRSDLLAQVGFTKPPETWDEWLVAMRKLKAASGRDKFAILIPTNEWEQPTIFALQSGSKMLRDGDRYGNFQSDAFRQAFEFYVSLFNEGFAPDVRNTEVSNTWEEFARGYFAMYITGPWNIGEFRRRLPADMQDRWATAVLPRPASAAHNVSQAGGSSLVIFRRSKFQSEAWKLIEFLSQPAQQIRFYELTGNLPPRKSSWEQGKLREDTKVAAFYEQLQFAVPLPRVPEWEEITVKLIHAGQATIAKKSTVDEALADLDRQVDELLDKRRWMLAKRDSTSN
jgi:multiple sugar transport system substrate-binding protein